jgi:hypothetical protein
MSLDESKSRSYQLAGRLAERLHISSQVRLISDRELFQKLKLDSIGSRVDLFEYFKRREQPPFYPSVDNREQTVAALRRFAGAENSIIDSADKVSEGIFHLLGFDDLRFGGRLPDWHLDPVSGKSSPLIHWTRISELDSEITGDKKIIWELNRHQYFSTLGQAYWLSNDEKYVDTFVEHIGSWMDRNPPKKGVNWLSSLELAFRSISWIWAFYFFKDSPRFTPDLFARMLKYLYLNGRHLETYLSTYYSPNTHLTGEALGLYFLGRFLPEIAVASRWKHLGHQILIDALDFQVRPDGSYCEQSSHYVRYTIDFYCNLLLLLRLEHAEIDAKILTKLHQLFDYLLHITQPNGHSPNFGDDDGGRFYFLDDREVTDFRPVFALGAVLLDRGDLKFAAGTASSELLWLLGLDGVDKFNNLGPVEPPARKHAFRDGGCFTSRTDWSKKADSILIHCGPFGFLNGGHAHAHTLSFALTIAGEPVFVDSGTYNYTSDLKERDAFRSSDAHNCLTVNGQSSSIAAGPFSWRSTATGRLLEWLQTPAGIQFRGSHDGFERFGVNYEREILFEGNGAYEIVDNLVSERPNQFQLHFVLSPNISAEILDRESSVAVKIPDHSTFLLIRTALSGAGAEIQGWSLEDCFVSPVYGAKLNSKKLIYTFAGAGVLRVRNTIEKVEK